MRLIDADALIDTMTKFSNATGEDMTHGIFYAHIAPTIDALPVVRCKDCKWYYRGGATCMYWDGANNMHGDDYCSSGRKAG